MAMDADADLSALALKTRVKFIDLNGDGSPEVIAQPVGIEAGCGATGNCPFWVFERTSTGYKAILKTAGQIVHNRTDVDKWIQRYRIGNARISK
jgi:hypothetical protein